MQEGYPNGVQLRVKKDTDFDKDAKFAGTAVNVAVDLWPPKSKDKTPARITWRIPNPGGLQGLCVEKLELDKAGAARLELSADASAHRLNGLRVDARADLMDPKRSTDFSPAGFAETLSKSMVTGFTYTGFQGTVMKASVKPGQAVSERSLRDLTAECTKSLPSSGVTLGLKLTPGSSRPSPALTSWADLGIRATRGPISAAVATQEGMTSLGIYSVLRASSSCRFATSCTRLGKKDSQCNAGIAYQLSPTTVLKAKVVAPASVERLRTDWSIFAALRHKLSRRITLLAGVKFDQKTGSPSYGLHLSME